MKRLIRFLSLTLTLVGVAVGQSGLTLSGTVQEKGTGKPLEGARIAVVGGRANSEITDSNGTFILKFPSDIHSGDPVRLHVEKQGYAPFTTTVAVSPSLPTPIFLERIKVNSRNQIPIPANPDTTKPSVEQQGNCNSVQYGGTDNISAPCSQIIIGVKTDPHFNWKYKQLEGTPDSDGHPGVTIAVAVEDTMDRPAFLATCDRPCRTQGGTVSGISQAYPLSPTKPEDANKTGVKITTPPSITPDLAVCWEIRSLDKNPIQITTVMRIPPNQIPPNMPDSFAPTKFWNGTSCF
jgi:hypothetical protein